MSPESQLEIPSVQSSVPLFSGASYEAISMTGVVWGFALHFALYMMHIAIDVFQWLLATILAGLVIQYLIAILKKRRFYNPVSNQNLLALFEIVKNDLGKGQGIELWYRDIDRGVFLSSTNPLFKAILLSDSTIADILQNEEKGKIVLAKEVLTIERLSPMTRATIGLLGFIFAAFIESMSAGAFLDFMTFPAGPAILAILTLAILIAVASIPYLRARSSSKIDQVLEDLYGIPADAARIEVLTGFKISDEMIEEAKSDQTGEASDRRRDALRKGAISAILALFMTFMITYLLISNLPFAILASIFMSAVIAFVVFVLVFMTSMMWPLLSPSGKRDTKHDMQIPFASEVQRFLNQFLEDNEVTVTAVKHAFKDEYALIVTRLDDNYKEQVLYAMLPQVLKDINDVELAGPLILSQIWRKDIERRYNQVGYIIAASAIILLIGSVFLSFASLGFEGFLLIMIPGLFIYLIVAAIPSILLSYWKRKAETKSDASVAKECPRLIEALQILTDKHHTLPYGMTSYRTRLDRIAKLLELGDEDRGKEPSYKID